MLRITLVTIFIIQTWGKIPPPDKGALMARYIVHNSEYTSIATLSTVPKIKGYPFVSITSISDGPPLNGSGNPYMYLPQIDFSATDLAQDNRVSLMMSLVQGSSMDDGSYCKSSHFDPEDPRCAHLMMSGRFVKIENGTEEYDFAKATLFERHPSMAGWPLDHGFFFAKVLFDQIAVQDKFGGPLLVTPEDYFNVKAAELNQYSDLINYKKYNNSVKVIKI